MVSVLPSAIFLAFFPSCCMALDNCRNFTQDAITCTDLTSFPINGSWKNIHIFNSNLSSLTEIDLSSHVETLTIANSKIQEIWKFKNGENLLDLNLEDNKISKIKAGAFDELKKLKFLNLKNNQLRTIPVFNRPNNIEKLYLAGNAIDELKAGALKNLSSLTELNLNNNQLRTIPVFNRPNNHIEKLYLAGNGIDELKPGALKNLSSLTELNLKNNQFRTIPVFNPNNNIEKLYLGNAIDELKPGALKNLSSLTELYLMNNKFTIIPDKFLIDIPNIKKLDFSNSPVKYIEENAFAGLDKLTSLDLDGTDIESLPVNGLEKLEILNIRAPRLLFIPPTNFRSLKKIFFYKDKSFLCCKIFAEVRSISYGPRTLVPFASTTPGPMNNTKKSNESAIKVPGGFENKQRRRVIVDVITAAPYNSSRPFVPAPPPSAVECSPGPTPFQPCENIMGADWLTAVSFIVALFALCGNFAVIVVLLCLARHYNVPRFLVTNLAVADMFMGVYLLSLVVESVITDGEYYKHVISFQYGLGCKVLGFMAVFASELSVCSLTLITVERYLTIVYALYPRRKLMIKNAAKLMGAAWVVSIAIALPPLLGVGSYKKVAICLPYEVNNGGKWYLLFLFSFNTISFLAIALLYIGIYRSVFISRTSTPIRSHDLRVASRMALLVLTDFACFAPITICALSAVFGNPLINVEHSKIFLVFFFPLNSFMNPLLYVLITKSFRRDFAALLKNCFVCGETLNRYLSSLAPGANAQSNHDPLSQMTRQSVDFNTLDFGQEGSGSPRAANELPCSATFSKSEPSLIRFSNLAMEHSNTDAPSPESADAIL